MNGFFVACFERDAAGDIADMADQSALCKLNQTVVQSQRKEQQAEYELAKAAAKTNKRKAAEMTEGNGVSQNIDDTYVTIFKPVLKAPPKKKKKGRPSIRP